MNSYSIQQFIKKVLNKEFEMGLIFLGNKKAVRVFFCVRTALKWLGWVVIF